jgi:hypothetical protein
MSTHLALSNRLMRIALQYGASLEKIEEFSDIFPWHVELQSTKHHERDRRSSFRTPGGHDARVEHHSRHQRRECARVVGAAAACLISSSSLGRRRSNARFYSHQVYQLVS